MLYRSNKLMYDRATRSLWVSFVGEPVIGALADSGIKLPFFPSSMTTWGEWLAEHPDTTVLSLETGIYAPSRYEPESDPGSFYFTYRADPDTMFPVWNRDTRLDTKEEVLGLSIGEEHKAFPVKVLQRERVVNDVLGDTGVVVVGSAISSSARAYASEGVQFTLPGGGATTDALPMSLTDASGVTWKITEEALVNTGDPSRTLARLPSQLSFWFGWFAFHPDTKVYGVDGGN